MLAGMLTLLAVGTLDDVVALTPSHKLLAQLTVVAFFLWAGPAAPEVTRWPLVNLGLAGFFMVAAINAFNLVDGLDGLAAGVGIAAMGAVGVVAWWSRDAGLACGALATAGALGGFLFFNFYPASIFMGDGGALPMGFLLGALALQGAGLQRNSHLSCAVFPVLVMLVPLLDTAIVTMSRLATGNPISRRGLDHSHHRLLMLGLTVRARGGRQLDASGGKRTAGGGREPLVACLFAERSALRDRRNRGDWIVHGRSDFRESRARHGLSATCRVSRATS